MRPDRHRQFLKSLLVLGAITLLIGFLALSPAGKPPTVVRNVSLSKQWDFVARDLILTASGNKGMAHLPRKITFATDQQDVQAYLVNMPLLATPGYADYMLGLAKDLAAGRPPQGPDLLQAGSVGKQTVWKINSSPWTFSRPNYLLLLRSTDEATVNVRISYGRD